MNLLKILLILVVIVSQVSCDDDNDIPGGSYYRGPPACLSIMNENNFLGEKLDIPEYNFTLELYDDVMVGRAFNAVAFGIADSLLENIIISKDISNYKILIFEKMKNVTIVGSGKAQVFPRYRFPLYHKFKADSIVFSLFLEDIFVKYEYKYSSLKNKISFVNPTIMSISGLAVQIEKDKEKSIYTLSPWNKRTVRRGRLLQITSGIEDSITSTINKNLGTMPQEDILRLKKECLEKL